MFQPFESKNFRLYFFGQLLSSIGTWMTNTASLWLAYEMTHSAFWLGIVGFAGQIPILFLSPFAGVLLDRWNRYRILMALQFFSILTSFALAYFVLSGTMNIGFLIGLSLLKGIILSFDMPARQSLLVYVVENRKLMDNAVTLTGLILNISKLVGPAIAGFVILKYGAGTCYALDGISFLMVLGALWMMHLKLKDEGAEKKHPWRELMDGIQYVKKLEPMWMTLLTVALISFFGASAMVLMPIFAKDVFAGDARTLGFLLSAQAMGACCSLLYLASRKSSKGLGQVIVCGCYLFTIGLVGVALSRVLALTLILLILAGIGFPFVYASANILLQSIVKDKKRGWVMSLFFMANFGVFPLGNLMMGWIGNQTSVFTALLCGGGMCAVSGCVFYSRMKRIHEQVEALKVSMESLET